MTTRAGEGGGVLGGFAATAPTPHLPASKFVRSGAFRGLGGVEDR
jgi:hypothetical protein